MLKVSILPLSILSLLTIGAQAFFLQADGFFINLSTEVIGILITVCYVDWILRRNQDRQWSATDELIEKRLMIMLNNTVSHIRFCMGFDVDVMDRTVTQSDDLRAAHGEVMRVA